MRESVRRRRRVKLDAAGQAASARAQLGAEYHRGAKEAFQRVAEEWPDSREKAQTWANNCAISETKHRQAVPTVPSRTREGEMSKRQHLTVICAWTVLGFIWGFITGERYAYEKLPSPQQIHDALLRKGLKCTEVPEYRERP